MRVKQLKRDLIVKLGQVGDFEIRLLKVFKAVVECGGFAAAETELNISRSTISIHIANLEQRLGFKLCRRGRAGFALTESGIEVYGLMRELFSSLELFRAGVNSLHVALTGELKIIASDTICMASQSLIPEAIARFSTEAPDVNVLLDVKALRDIERMLLSDDADIGFIPCHRRIGGLDYSPLYTESCHLYCSVKHPLFSQTISDASSLVDAAVKVVHAGIHTSPEVGEQMAGLNKAAISYFYEARLSMILSGAYIGFMPDSYVAEYVGREELKMLIPEAKHYDLGVAAVVRSQGKSNRGRDLFLEIVKELHQDAP
tara:strand:+ start:373 stop:1320 length:948 start_codon:yes stop_codon:yes gene_type:complete